MLLQCPVILFAVIGIGLHQQQAAELVILVLLVVIQRDAPPAIGERVDVRRNVVLGSPKPLFLDVATDNLRVRHVLEHVQVFNQQKFIKGGDVSGSQLVALDNVGE